VGNKALQQIPDPICQPLVVSLAFPPVAPLKLRRKNLLRRYARLMKGDPPIWPDGVFAQLPSGTTRAVEHNEHFAALRRDLDACPGGALRPGCAFGSIVAADAKSYDSRVT